MGRKPGAWAVLAAVALVACVPAPQPMAGAIAGEARVVDGDTIEVRSRDLRLAGVDAPELRQTCTRDGRAWPCGRAAAQALARKIGGRPVACAWRDVDRWGRPLASCHVGEVDLAAWLTERGWALAFRRYALTYAAEEARARRAGRGLWSGSFVAPWEHRAG